MISKISKSLLILLPLQELTWASLSSDALIRKEQQQKQEVPQTPPIDMDMLLDAEAEPFALTQDSRLSSSSTGASGPRRRRSRRRSFNVGGEKEEDEPLVE